MKALLKNGYKAKLRPSGHDISTKFGIDNGGTIPPNFIQNSEEEEVTDLIELSNTESNSRYLLRCKEAGIKPHPARFPKAFASFFIKFTTDEGDLVLDPFAGSNTTGSAAEDLGRRWAAIELNESYLEGSKFRFDGEANMFDPNPTLNGKTPKI